MLHVLGLPTGAQLDTWPHRGPSLWVQGAAATGHKQTSPFSCHTRALTPPVQAWPRHPAFSSSPSVAAEVCFGCKYKGSKVQAQRCTTAATAALICVTYIKVHPLHHPLCHRGSQPSQPQQSITSKLTLLSPKALAATSPPSPLLSQQMATTKQLSFLGSWEDGERDGEAGHIRIGYCFPLKALKEENSSLIPSCLRQVFVRDSPRSLRGHLSCRRFLQGNIRRKNKTHMHTHRNTHKKKNNPPK